MRPLRIDDRATRGSRLGAIFVALTASEAVASELRADRHRRVGRAPSTRRSTTPGAAPSRRRSKSASATRAIASSCSPRTRRLPRKPTRENVRAAFARLRTAVRPDDVVLVLLIGHGTAVEARRRRRQVQPRRPGPDRRRVGGPVKPMPGRLVFVNAARAAFRSSRSSRGRGRIVLTATDSAAQQFETVFPEFFVKAFGDAAADADKNGRVSIWEAFSYGRRASRRGSRSAASCHRASAARRHRRRHRTRSRASSSRRAAPTPARAPTAPGRGDLPAVRTGRFRATADAELRRS